MYNLINVDYAFLLLSYIHYRFKLITNFIEYDIHHNRLIT